MIGGSSSARRQTLGVRLRREGENVTLAPRPTSWATFFASELKASPNFLSEREQEPPQGREFGRSDFPCPSVGRR